MASRRSKFLSLTDQELNIDFGTYGLIMYYAKQINAVKAKKFFDATLSEFKYRVYYELPIDNYTDIDEEAHFIPADIQQVIDFIDQELIPALNNETNLILKYGGATQFESLFNSSVDYLGNIGLDSNEYYEQNINRLIWQLKQIKSLFQQALILNQPYLVYLG